MNDTLPNVHDGHFVSISGNRLVRMSSSGEQYAHLLASDTRLTCDGIVCRTNDLCAGQRIRVTTRPNDQRVALRIEVLNTHDRFVPQA